MNTHQKVNKWIADWKTRDYFDDIPDEVPDVLMKNNLAPSYKQIALAILKNDMQMESLGFTPKFSEFYSAIKRLEIKSRPKK